jgi:hypothetical protein
MYVIIQDDYPRPGWDLILRRVLKIRSSPWRMAVNFPLFEQPVSSRGVLQQAGYMIFR